MKNRLGNFQKSILVAALAIASTTANATSISWNFDLPAVGIPAIHSVYPNVATLTLSDVAGGVQFVLAPNGSSPGAKGTNGVDSYVQKLQFVYTGSLSGALTATGKSGASIDSISVGSNANMDSSYKSGDKYIEVDFFNNAPNHAHPIDNRFDFSQSSTWTLSGMSLTDLTGVLGTANNKPSPIHGIISVAPYDLTDPHPTPSNWVSGAENPSAVPIPAAAWLFGSALFGFVSMSKRKKV